MHASKLVFPLLLVASAAWAATEAGVWANPAAPPRQEPTVAAQAVPWPVEETEGARANPHHPEAAPSAVHGEHSIPPAECPAGAATSPHPAALRTAPHGDPHRHARFVPQHEVDLETPVAPSRASNGATVAELHRDAQQLSGQRARVRATVVKQTEGIRGKTYAHLRDGSGSLEGRDNDLTVTTRETLELGQTVEFEGTVQVDQDLGLGYRYPVLLQDAKTVEDSSGASTAP